MRSSDILENIEIHTDRWTRPLSDVDVDLEHSLEEDAPGFRRPLC